ncbi:MAG: hypothetical protein ABIR59_02275 [Gemmatimonadales bacterium]
MTRVWVLLLLIATGASSPGAAQSAALVAGRAAMEAMDLPAARRNLQAAVSRDPSSYEANWRLALVLGDIAEQLRDASGPHQRDSLYSQSERYARRAVAANDRGADGHFVLASALGRSALTRGTKERLRIAAEIRSEAERAIALDPRHHGALHVLGRWHAEIRRLSGTERFLARTFMRGGILKTASWEAAESNLRAAVRFGPDVIYHRLDLAEVQAEREEWAAARAQLDTLASLPVRDPIDTLYQARGRALATKIARKGRS